MGKEREKGEKSGKEWEREREGEGKRGKREKAKVDFAVKICRLGKKRENQKYHISFPQCIYRTAAMIALVRMTITNALTHRQGPPTSPWP